jgi:hypothetical protein
MSKKHCTPHYTLRQQFTHDYKRLFVISFVCLFEREQNYMDAKGNYEIALVHAILRNRRTISDRREIRRAKRKRFVTSGD